MGHSKALTHTFRLAKPIMPTDKLESCWTVAETEYGGDDDDDDREIKNGLGPQHSTECNTTTI